MKFALLGCNDDVLALVEAMRDARRNPLDSSAAQVIACYEIPAEFEKPLRTLVPHAIFDEEWEATLHGTVADAVIVAPRSDEERQLDQLRKLVQALPVVLVQPCCEAIVGYELDMIRSDSGLAIVPYVRGMTHPLWDELIAMADGRDQRIGSVRQLTLAHSMAVEGREQILAALSLDSSRIRAILGHLTDITATGVAHDDPDYRSVMVHFTSEKNVPARWSLEALPANEAGRLTLVGETGQAVLTIAQAPDAWKLVVDTPESQTVPAEFRWPHDELLAVQGRLDEADPDRWLDACRDLEVADTVAYSLRRGRKVNLISDAPSEEGTFKGVMAAGGCGILLLAFFAVIGMSMVEGFRYPARRNQWDQERQTRNKDNDQVSEVSDDKPNVLLRIWPVYPLLIFLALQTLRIIARPRQRNRHGRSDDDKPAP